MSEPDLEKKMAEAIASTRNLGEMEDADAVGTNGDDCGDMLQMWVKFREEGGRKVIDRATFQTFGCQTAIAVASVATEMIKGKTIEEAMDLSGDALSAPLGPLPPMKIHCAQLVEGALRNALTGTPANPASQQATPDQGTLFNQLAQTSESAKPKTKIVFQPKEEA